MKILQILFISIFYFFINTHIALDVEIGPSGFCNPTTDQCVPAYACSPSKLNPGSYTCQPVFGTITPPAPISAFIGNDTTGAKGISKFFSNLIVLIYSLATVALILMIIWGAFDWVTSEGDKEKIASARSKIINAVIGIMLFSVAFAAIQVLGQFTGFKFCVSQK